MEKEINLPIDHFSYSSLTQLLRNPIIFKMKYVLGIYDTKIGLSGMVGRAGHEALKAYYGGCDECVVSADKNIARGEAIDWGLKFLENYDDHYIDYGKTGSRELMLKTYMKALQHYFAEEPEYNELLMVEEKMKGEMFTIDGDVLPLPATGIPDVVHKRKDGGIEIIDTKFVKTFTDYESEDYIKIIQSQFLYHLLRSVKGLTADRMLFREIKVTENQADKITGKVPPQIRDYAIPFNHEPYRILFYNIYNDCVKYLSNDPVFLPNLSDLFDGEQAGLVYAQGLINADMTDVEVMHKVKDIAFTSKKFMSSRLDSVENKHLLPEEKIKLKLAEFGIPVEPVENMTSSTITQYRFKVSAGIRMGVFQKHKADIVHAIQAKGEIRILAPIPGTSLIGIEVENDTKGVTMMEKNHLTPGTLMLPLGTDVSGNIIKLALNSMPHLLIAGTTGSGKSVLIHSIIEALTGQLDENGLQLILVDPKRVELARFAKLPHVHGKRIIYEYKDAVMALLGLVEVMEKRYDLLEKHGKRDIKEYNESKKKPENRLDYKVMIFDEFADFMMRAKLEENEGGVAYGSKSKPWLHRELLRRAGPKMHIQIKGESDEDARSVIVYKNPANYDKDTLIEMLERNDMLDITKGDDANVEKLVVRLAQMARAVGIHLVIATQSPRVDVITGIIKANMPTRIALTTSSSVESKIIIDEGGAEKLGGKGDMILMTPGMPKTRLQGFMLKQK